MSMPAAASPVERLTATVAAFDALSDRLVELDCSPAVALADPVVRRGRSATVAAAIRDDLAAVWEVYPALSRWRAEAVGARGRDGARRALGRPVAMGGGAVRAEDAVARAAGLLDGAQRRAAELSGAWVAVVARADAWRGRLSAAAGEPGALPEACAAAGEAIDAWAEGARADPLDPPADAVAESALAALEHDVVATLELGARRRRVAERLPERAAELDRAALALAAVPEHMAAAFGAASASSPASVGGDPDAPLPGVAVAMGRRAVAMADRLRRLAGDPALVATPAALGRAEALEQDAGRLVAEVRRMADELGGPLRERAELRGLAAALVVASAALGLDADPAVRAAGAGASAALVAEPTDLPTCRRMVAALADLVGAGEPVARWEPQPEPQSGRLSGPAATTATVEVFAAAPERPGPGEPPEVHALVTLTPPRPTSPSRPRPRRVVLVIDCSGSMDDPPAKIAAARSAAAAAIDLLPDGTDFALVAGTSEAALVYPARADATSVAALAPAAGTGEPLPALARADGPGRAAARHAARALTAGGATEMSKWLRLCRRLFDAAGEGDHHVVLVADGRNAGGDGGILERELDAGRGRFRCDCVGLGPHGDTPELRSIAEALDGTFTVVGPGGLVAALVAAVGRAASAAPRSVELQVWPEPGAEVRFVRSLDAGAGEGPHRFHVCVEIADSPDGPEGTDSPDSADRVGESVVARAGAVLDGEVGPTEPIRA